MKKLLFLAILVIGGIWTYFWYVRGVNLVDRDPAVSPLPAYSPDVTQPVKDANGNTTRWQLAAPMPTPRIDASAAALGGKIYVVGGMDSFARILATVEAFDVASGTWSTVAPLPEPVVNAAVVSDGVKLYVFGGLEGLAFTPVDRAYSFDPATGSWAPVMDMPGPLGAAGVAVHDGKVHLIGGLDLGRSTQAHHSFDPESGVWMPDEPIISGRNHLMLATIDGKIYAAGGRAGSLVYNINALEIYDVSSRTWEQGANMPGKRSSGGAAAIGGLLYVVGGAGPSSVFGDVFAYDPAADRWKAVDNMPTERHGFAYAEAGGRIYTFGGGRRPGLSVSDIVEVFTP